MSRFFEHILQQRRCNTSSNTHSHRLMISFYPIFPPHVDDCVDVSLLRDAEIKEFSPDILIVPSKKDGFVKVLMGI